MFERLLRCLCSCKHCSCPHCVNGWTILFIFFCCYMSLGFRSFGYMVTSVTVTAFCFYTFHIVPVPCVNEIWEKIFRGQNFLPRIQGIISRGRNVLPQNWSMFSRGGFFFTQIWGAFLRSRNILPWIRGIISRGRNILPWNWCIFFRGRDFFTQNWGTISRDRNVLSRIWGWLIKDKNDLRKILDIPSNSLKTLYQIREKASQNFKNQPENWERLMQGWQKHAPDLGEDFAWGAKTCLRIRGRFCMGGRNMPEIWGKILHGVHKRASDLGEDFARGA